ncbi:flagellin [Kiloniella laminariae]|uniref:Flagellin n=1 Tax=Kiloniella laminariae TaxID=454162 RepID=A0ABT4LL02_9PROT|nr:flagellin [Kiloniella laminariae]MCZ4281793.1 flagellin [Kiloniella laminariae]
MPTVNGSSYSATTLKNSLIQQNNVNKLASGSNFPKASDAAASLAISAVLQADTVVLNQNAATAAQGASIGQIADGGLARISEGLVRLKELAGQALGASQDPSSLNAINAEFVQIRDEISGVAGQTTFNGQGLLDNTGSQSFLIGTDVGDTINLDNVDATGGALGISGLTVDTVGNATTALASIDNAINVVSGYRAGIGAAVSRFEVAGENIASQVENVKAANSALADSDIAAQVTSLVTSKVLNEVGLSARAQANNNPQALLRLLER